MSNTLMTLESFESVLARIAETTGATTQEQLAELLGVRQPSVSDAKRRDRIPAGWLLTLLRKFRLNPDWMLTGLGARYLTEAGNEPIA